MLSTIGQLIHERRSYLQGHLGNGGQITGDIVERGKEMCNGNCEAANEEKSVVGSLMNTSLRKYKKILSHQRHGRRDGWCKGQKRTAKRKRRIWRLRQCRRDGLLTNSIDTSKRNSLLVSQRKLRASTANVRFGLCGLSDVWSHEHRKYANAKEREFHHFGKQIWKLTPCGRCVVLC
jgi:hypothetical protein